MPNIIELNLLDNKSIVAKKQGIPLANENSYKIIAGEENATIFKVVSIPNQYKDKSFTIEMVNAKGYGIAEAPIADINNYEFYLPVGMAVAGYSYILFRCKYTENRKDVVVPFQPLKVKVWNTIPEWKEYITNQTNARIENGYLILEENGVEHNLGYVKGEKGDSGDIASQEILDNIEREINDLYLIANETVTGTEEVTGAYTIRQTANGLSGLIDGALTRVEKVQGTTKIDEYVPSFNGLKHAYFKGIKSTGRNLFNPNRTVVNFGGNATETVRSFTPNGIILGLTYTNIYAPVAIENFSYENGVVSFSTTNTFYGIGFNFDCNGGEIYRFSWKESKANSEMYVVFYKNGVFDSYDYIQNSHFTTPLGCNQIVILIRINIASEVVEFSNLQLEYGDTATEYEPYKEDTSLSLDNAVELGKWDYIDVKDKKLIRQTSYLTQETPFTEEQLENYSEYVLSADLTTIAYKSETPNETYLDIPTDKYPAWSKGRETVIQGETDNSQYGAECAIGQLYAVKKGVSE